MPWPGLCGHNDPVLNIVTLKGARQDDLTAMSPDHVTMQLQGSGKASLVFLGNFPTPG